jgi:hypothetical protein
VVLPLALAATAACSDGDDGGIGAIAGGGGIAQHLAALPAAGEDDARLVVYGDLQAAAEVAGVERPDDLRDGDAALEYLNAITGGPVEAEGGDRRASPVAASLPEMAVDMGPELEGFADDVGWSVLDVDRFAEHQSPPDSTLVLDGRFDAGRIDEAMGERDDGVWMVGDPDGDLSVRDQTPARRLGQPLWQSLDGDRLVVTGSAESMEAARSAGGSGRTLADDPVFRPLADALDGQDVYTAMLLGQPPGSAAAGAIVQGGSDGSDGSDVSDARERVEEVCDQVLAETPVGVATGLSDDGGPVVVLVLLHGSEEAAGANADAVRRIVEEGSSLLTREPWSERLSVDEVTTDGETTVARLRVVDDSPAAIWRDMVHRQDSLVTSC